MRWSERFICVASLIGYCVCQNLAWAEESPQSASPPTETLCRSMESDAERLKCYDAAAASQDSAKQDSNPISETTKPAPSLMEPDGSSMRERNTASSLFVLTNRIMPCRSVTLRISIMSPPAPRKSPPLNPWAILIPKLSSNSRSRSRLWRSKTGSICGSPIHNSHSFRCTASRSPPLFAKRTTSRSSCPSFIRTTICSG